MKSDDIKEVVAIHLRSFPNFFLSYLGKYFLTIYYKACCSERNGICFVTVEDDGRLSGFVVGSINPKTFYHRLLVKYWYLFGLAAIPSLIRRPRIFFRLMRAWHYPSETPGGDDNAGLYSLAVAPEIQRSGRGRILVSGFLKEARLRGCNRVYLNTDRDDNDMVNQFYRSLHFQISRRYCTPEGRWMNEYVYLLSNGQKI